MVRREGEPTAEELSNENLLQIVAQSCTDEEVNFLLWKCLGEVLFTLCRSFLFDVVHDEGMFSLVLVFVWALVLQTESPRQTEP